MGRLDFGFLDDDITEKFYRLAVRKFGKFYGSRKKFLVFLIDFYEYHKSDENTLTPSERTHAHEPTTDMYINPIEPKKITTMVNNVEPKQPRISSTHKAIDEIVEKLEDNGISPMTVYGEKELRRIVKQLVADPRSRKKYFQLVKEKWKEKYGVNEEESPYIEAAYEKLNRAYEDFKDNGGELWSLDFLGTPKCADKLVLDYGMDNYTAMQGSEALAEKFRAEVNQ